MEIEPNGPPIRSGLTRSGKVIVIIMLLVAFLSLLVMIGSARAMTPPTGPRECLTSDELKIQIANYKRDYPNDPQYNLEYIRSMSKPELILLQDRMNRDLKVSQPEKDWDIILPSIDLYRGNGLSIIAAVFNDSGCFVYAFKPDPKYELK